MGGKGGKEGEKERAREKRREGGKERRKDAKWFVVLLLDSLPLPSVLSELSLSFLCLVSKALSPFSFSFTTILHGPLNSELEKLTMEKLISLP